MDLLNIVSAVKQNKTPNQSNDMKIRLRLLQFVMTVQGMMRWKLRLMIDTEFQSQLYFGDNALQCNPIFGLWIVNEDRREGQDTTPDQSKKEDYNVMSAIYKLWKGIMEIMNN